MTSPPVDRTVSDALSRLLATDVGSAGPAARTEPDATAEVRGDRRAVGATVAALLGRFGLADTATRDDIEAAVLAVLTQRGHTDVEVAGVRWKTLTVTCPPAAAALLRIDAQQLQAELAGRFGDQVARVVVTTRPPTRVTTRMGARPSEVPHGAPPPTDRS